MYVEAERRRRHFPTCARELTTAAAAANTNTISTTQLGCKFA